MYHLIIVILILLFFYLFFVRLCGILLRAIFINVFKVEISIGKFGLFSIRNVVIRLKNGMHIEMESVQLKSSLISSKFLKPVTILIKDARLNVDRTIYSDINTKKKEGNAKKFDALNLVSRSFLQYVSILGSNITVMFMDGFLKDCLLSLSLHTIKINCDKDLKYGLETKSVALKLLRHETKIPDRDPCLMEIVFNLRISLSLILRDALAIQDAVLECDNPDLTINEDLLSMLPKSFGNSKSSKESKVNSSLKFLPEESKISVNSLKTKIIRNANNSPISFILKSISSSLTYLESDNSYTAVSLPSNVDFTMRGLLLSYSGCNVISLDKISLQNKILREEVESDMSIQTVIIYYNQLMNFDNILHSLPSSSKSQSSHQPKKNIAQVLLSKKINLSFEASDVQVKIDMLEEVPNLNCGMEYCKLSVEHLPDLEGSLGISRSELLLDTIWLALDEKETFSPNAYKKFHRWNTPLLLGAVLIKIKIQDSKIHLQGLFDSMQLEWCKKLYHLIDRFLLNRTSKSDKRVKDKNGGFCIQSCSITFSSSNIFYVTDVGTCCVAIRVDDCSFKMLDSLKKLDLLIDGICLSVTKSTQVYACCKAQEITNSAFFAKNISLHKSESHIDATIAETVHAKWCVNTHMVFLSLVEEVKSIKNSIRAEDSLTPIESSSRSGNDLSIKLNAITNCKLCALVSKNNTITIDLANFMAESSKDMLSFEFDESHVFFNEHDIFQIQKMSLRSLPTGHPLQRSRNIYDGFELSENKSFLLNFTSILVQFPYQFDFAEVAAYDAVNIVKWLKIVHKVKSSTEGSLKPDLVIQIKEISVEIKDDPFEVKLRDNYELLEDEQKEWEKRKAILDDKIEAIRKSHLLLPAGKLEELYENLAKRNAELYIQRCTQVVKNYSKNATLCLWSCKDLELFIVNDSSLHGQENVIRIMKEIDQDSPFPETGMLHSTLWCRVIHVTCQSLQIKLRDFPQSLMEVSDLLVWGRLVGAEQESTQRSRYSVKIDLDESYAEIERGMQYLKFYHDLSCHVNHWSLAYGLCWEPVLSQLGQSMEYITKPSSDPSPPLTFWDKARLLYHGRLTMSVEKLSIMLHASLDPYNMTEEMEISWSPLYFDWTNGKFVLKGDMDMLIHTASKYDDCRLVHLPGLKLLFKLDWLCLGHPNDHHSVVPCARDKIPEYSSNEQHDSFRAFRSENLDLSIVLETKQTTYLGDEEDVPKVLFYANTMRWFENLKMILSGVSRPTRRGVLFNNVKPRKKQMSRHYKNIRLSLCLHKVSVNYWMSFAEDRGFEIHNGCLSLSSEQSLSLMKIEDGLIHRPLALWSISYMNCELNDSEIWLLTIQKKENQDVVLNSVSHDRSFFLEVSKVSYGREASFQKDLMSDELNSDGVPTHRLVIYNLRGSWTVKNRDLVLALIDAYQKFQLLKRNLSTDALKSVKVENSVVTPVKSRSMSAVSSGSTGTPSNQLMSGNTASNVATPSPMSKLQTNLATNMLHKLISEADSNVTVYTEELTDTTYEQQLQGVSACQTDDVCNKDWLIELVNSQVMLKGTDTPGYMIISAAKTQILKRVHRPVWRHRMLCSKTTWVGSLECMQYYATVEADDMVSYGDQIMWLSLENIEEKDSMVIADVPDMVGSGQSVGGVVSDTVGVTDVANIGTGENPIQLQRIVSRCSCQFFYASYDEGIDPDDFQEVIPLPETANLWDDTAVDSLSVVHNELNCSSNSQQYLMILDIIDNLLLYTEPKKKESYEQLQRMKFQLQLSSIDDQRKPILQLQNNVRMLVQKLRRLQKEAYLIGKMLNDSMDDEALASNLAIQYDQCENDVNDCKEQLNAVGDELTVMISCFKETQLSAQQNLLRSSKDQQLLFEKPAKRNEVCFRHAKWRLTEADGQLGIADIVLANFLYTKVTKNDNSVEHLQELGYVKIENSLPNQVYKIALQPTELQGNIPLDRQRVLRVYCREKAPVGGISIKEHFEINVTPFTISITRSFVSSMLKFFFPGRESENSDVAEDESKQKKKRAHQSKNLIHRNRDDIEKMKERAEQNKLFLFIKIPEVPIKVSYKGEKEKNIEDIHDFSLLLPTLEYHSVTWTWLDLLMNVKNESKKVLLSQAIKQKLQIKLGKPSSDDIPLQQEEDKARMLLGSKIMGVEKGTKKGLFGRHK